MAKKKKSNKSGGDKPNPDLFENSEENVGSNDKTETVMGKEENKEETKVEKSKDDLYKEIQGLKPKAKYQKSFEENSKAIKGESGAKKRVVTLAGSNRSIAYEEIMASIAYAIKSHDLYFMFDMTEAQRKFVSETPLNWFAQKKILG